MNKLLTIILCLLTGSLAAQKMPETALYRVRITTNEQNTVLEVKPVNNPSRVFNDKQYYWYSANAVHITQGGYSGKPLNGEYRTYYANKALKEAGAFNAGLKDGLWKNWSEGGALKQSMTWSKGLRSGPFELYTDSGKLLTSGKYHNGLFDGALLSYSGKDSVSTTWYKNGLIVPKRPPFFKRLPLIRKRNHVKKDTIATEQPIINP